MDVFTHFLLPYAALIVLFDLHRARRHGLSSAADAVWTRRAALAAVFGLAGFAPDLDGFVSWLKHQPGLYFMQHRGVSHSLLGAPVFAVLTALGMAGLARLFPVRLALFRWRAAFVPAAILGSWTHLVLDGLTYGGIPLWWPFAWGRPSLGFFHWIVDWFFPIGMVATGLHLSGVIDRRGMAKVAGVLVAVLVVLAAVQVATRPDPEVAGALVFTRHEPGEFTVLFPVENGWVARIWSHGDYRGYFAFQEEIEPGSEAAIARAKATDAYKGFRMGSFGPVVVRTAADGSGGWNVSFQDVAQRFEAMMNPDWTPTTNNWSGTGRSEWGHLRLSVSGDGDVRVTSWGW